jgi:hypothetical protein
MKVQFNGDSACSGIALGRHYTLRPGENEMEDRVGRELIRVGTVVPVVPKKEIPAVFPPARQSTQPSNRKEE